MTDVLFYMRMNVHMYIYQPHSSHVIFVGVQNGWNGKWKFCPVWEGGCVCVCVEYVKQ